MDEKKWIRGMPRILIVDDVASNRIILEDIIEDMGCEAVLAENGKEALQQVSTVHPHLILSDISMPEMDGYEFCRVMKGNTETRDIPIIFISAFKEEKDIIEGFQVGGADYVTKPFIPAVIEARIGVHLKLYETNQNLSETNRRLQTLISEQVKQLEQEKKNILHVLSEAAKRNSGYDEVRMERCCYNSRILTQAMQLSPLFESRISDEYVNQIELAVPLCDLGNIAVPPEILQKERGRTQEEERIYRNHTTVGAKFLSDINTSSDYNDYLTVAIEVAHYHHENWDGSGYPCGLAGEKIPLSAQIVAVVDAWCSLNLERTEAMEVLRKDSGHLFNPDVLDVCRKIVRQLR